MRVNPCGTAVDLIRSCYTTLMRPLIGNDSTVTVRWFFTRPDAPFLPVPTTFCSRNWEGGSEPWPQVGEVEGAERGWENGATPDDNRLDGSHFCGPADWWKNGIPAPPATRILTPGQKALLGRDVYLPLQVEPPATDFMWIFPALVAVRVQNIPPFDVLGFYADIDSALSSLAAWRVLHPTARLSVIERLCGRFPPKEPCPCEGGEHAGGGVGNGLMPITKESTGQRFNGGGVGNGKMTIPHRLYLSGGGVGNGSIPTHAVEPLLLSGGGVGDGFLLVNFSAELGLAAGGVGNGEWKTTGHELVFQAGGVGNGAMTLTGSGAAELIQWVKFDSSGTVLGSSSGVSVSHVTTGRYQITWGAAFANANYAVAIGAMSDQSTFNNVGHVYVGSQTTTVVSVVNEFPGVAYQDREMHVIAVGT